MKTIDVESMQFMTESNTFDQRIAAAAKALNLTTEEFKSIFDSRIGLETCAELDDENLFKFGDFARQFEDRPIEERPIGKIRKAFAALKSSAPEKCEAIAGKNPETLDRVALLKQLGLKIRLEDADPSVLFAHYLPDKPGDPVTQALLKRYKDKPVVAFNDDGTVAVKETVQYISDIEQGYPEHESILVGTHLARLLRVGVKPCQMVNEDPLFPGQPLRNGYSLVNHRNWNGITDAVRALCRIIVTRGDIDPNNHDAVLRLLQRASEQSATAGNTTLSDAYPEADLEFRERAQKDTLPKLKVELGNLTKQQNPFGVRRQY